MKHNVDGRGSAEEQKIKFSPKYEAKMTYWCLMKSMTREGIVQRIPEYRGKKVVKVIWRKA